MDDIRVQPPQIFPAQNEFCRATTGASAVAGIRSGVQTSDRIIQMQFESRMAVCSDFPELQIRITDSAR